MGMTGIYYIERNNIEQILNGDAGQPDLDIDKAWSLIGAMFPDVLIVPVTETYRVDSTLTEFGTFYLSPEQVASIAAQVPELQSAESLKERIHFEEWKNSSGQLEEQLEGSGSADIMADMAKVLPFMFMIHEDETYEDVVDHYVLPHLETVFDLFERARAEDAGVVFAIF